MNESIFRGSKLCVVGNINRDIKTAPLHPGDHLFRDGETTVSSILETVGGGGANSAFAAAALGANVTFLGKVGADLIGKTLERTLLRNGITSYLARDEAHATGTSINLTFETGQRHFVSCLPNNESLSFDDLNLEGISKSDHLLRSDIWFSEDMLFGGNERLFQVARQAGLAVSIDLNWDPYSQRESGKTVSRRKQAVRTLLPLVNIAHGNVQELNEFADSTDLMTTLRRLEEWGVEAVVVHLGAKGAGYYQWGKYCVEPSLPAAAQVNTTGTGDVLSVCMILLHRQETIPNSEKLRLANKIVSEFIEGRRQLIPSIPLEQ
jgi:sugar/nucleoside kinase (ribokinase family)